jgi:hypothetical protein
MKIDSLRPPAVRTYAQSVDTASVQTRLEALVDETAAATLSAADMSAMMRDGIAAFSSLLRAFPVQEGRLLERGISLLARYNPDLTVLTQNLRLPVSPAALELVEKNNEALVRGLTLDVDARSRKTYTPDLIILNRVTSIAHLIDVKRSLSSYENTRIADLKTRMLASALVVPDLLWKEHQRLVATDVRVVIIDASGRRTDIEHGIWPLSHLDHLLEVNGAADAAMALREMFHARVDANWHSARDQMIADAMPAVPPAKAIALDGISADHAQARPNIIVDAKGKGAGAPIPGPDDPIIASSANIRFGFARAPGVAH